MRSILLAAFLISAGACRAAEGDGTPLACRADADCPTPSCGPCTPGTALTREGVYGVSCAVNPCREPRSVCGPAGRCVVGPGVTGDPRVLGPLAR